MQLAKLSLIIYFKLSSGYSSELFKYKDNAPLAMSIDPEPDVNDDPFASQNDRTGKDTDFLRACNNLWLIIR